MEQFTFNEYGVCTNPNTITCEDKRYGYTIKTAQKGKRWFYAYDCHYPIGGYGSGVTATPRDKSFNEEDDAISTAAEKVCKFFDRHMDKKYKAPQTILTQLNVLIRKHKEPIQLSFNF